MRTSVASSPPTDAERQVAEQFYGRAPRDPRWFAEQVLGVHWWSLQVAIAESVRDHRNTAVRSGHGVGKTYVAAGIVLWFLYSFLDSRVISTAPTFQAVERLLWHEINVLHSRARWVLGGDCHVVKIDIPDGRFALGLSSDPARAESFQGHHAKHLLLIVDEASGVDERIYEAADGYMSTDGAKRLLIGNPTRPGGEFYDAFHSKRGIYNCLHVSALDSPAITGEPVPEDVRSKLTGSQWVEEKRAAWGEASPMFQVRVLGNFPPFADDTVCSLADVEEAQARELLTNVTKDRITIGVDVARFGSDETVIALRVADRIRLHETYVGKPTTETTGRLLALIRSLPGPALTVVIDDDGIGGGVTDQLREQVDRQHLDTLIEVVAFHGGERAYQENDYPNRRSEMWFAMAGKLPTLDLDPDDQLAADLTSPKYGYDSRGRRVVESKDFTKKRLGRSPDRADACLLTLVQERGRTPVREERTRESMAQVAGLTGDLLTREM